MKVYAVRKGRQTGIFQSWDQCKAQVNGFPGAEFKSFPSEAEAIMYLEGSVGKKTRSQKRKKTKSRKHLDVSLEYAWKGYDLTAYVDGSFNSDTDVYSYGMVVLDQNGLPIHEYSEAFVNGRFADMWNVAGELEGAIAAIKYAKAQKVKKLLICHDYKGIQCWPDGEWKANKEGTRAYVRFVQDARISGMQIDFKKVKGHSGVKWNERADELAKNAIQNIFS